MLLCICEAQNCMRALIKCSSAFLLSVQISIFVHGCDLLIVGSFMPVEGMTVFFYSHFHCNFSPILLFQVSYHCIPESYECFHVAIEQHIVSSSLCFLIHLMYLC